MSLKAREGGAGGGFRTGLRVAFACAFAFPLRWNAVDAVDAVALLLMLLMVELAGSGAVEAAKLPISLCRNRRSTVTPLKQTRIYRFCWP